MSKHVKVPIKEVVDFEKIIEGDNYCYVDRWWHVTEDDCILFYNGFSPQCNSHKSIIERSPIKGARPVFLSRVVVPMKTYYDQDGEHTEIDAMKISGAAHTEIKRGKQ